MNYRQLGNTGIRVSEIGFGGWGIGGTPMDAKAYGPTDDNQSRNALFKALELGITFFDTAALYGYGHSEKLIGEVIKGARQRVIISSKVGYRNFTGEQDFSPAYIRESLECSLKRLQTDHIDVYQLHDPTLALLESDARILETMESLKREGKIRAIGISVRSPDDSMSAIKLFSFETIQVNFNLVDMRALEFGLFDRCEKQGIGIIIRTPLCFGFLTGAYSSKSDYHARDHRSNWSPDQIERWGSAYKLFAAELAGNEELTNGQIALRFCLSFLPVSTVIPGMLTPEHVRENAMSSQLGPFPASVTERFTTIYKENQFFIKTR